MLLRYSAIASYLKCPKAYEYAWTRQLQKNTINYKMLFGTLFHRGMEAYWKSEPIIKSIEECASAFVDSSTPDYEICAIDELKERVIPLVDSAIHFFDCDKYISLGAELAIEQDTKDGQGFQGHVDVLLQEKETGDVWVVDYKTRERFKDENEEQYNYQLSLYEFVLAKKHPQMRGSMVWEVSNKTFETPKILKNGTVSKALISTTWDRYKKFVEDCGLNVGDYLEMRSKLSQNEWFSNIKLFKTKAQLQNTFDDTVQIIDRVHSHNGDFYRNMTPGNCSWCDFKELCRADLDGRDTSDLLTFMYRMRK